jgi:cytochrome c oxidase cbb3-type subunit II
MLIDWSPMPEYPWLFNGAPDKPNKRGLALITYVQWLGSWLDSYPYYEELESIKSEGY